MSCTGMSGGPLATGHQYELAELRFHWGREENRGSEHTVNGMAYPMEVPSQFPSTRSFISSFIPFEITGLIPGRHGPNPGPRGPIPGLHVPEPGARGSIRDSMFLIQGRMVQVQARFFHSRGAWSSYYFSYRTISLILIIFLNIQF